MNVERKQRKRSLGMRKLKPDQWSDIANKYPIGSKHKGTVRNYTNFGVFVELEEGIDGLVYISDLSWTQKVKHPSDFVQVGDSLEVVVLELDVEGRKLNLGHKQTKENPWNAKEALFVVGSIHSGTIKEKNAKGAIIIFEGDDAEAFAPARLLEKEDGTKLDKGDTAEFKVIEFNKDFRKIVVSHTAIFKEEEKKNLKAANKKAESADKSTLGDISVLAALKEELEKKGK